MSEMCERWKNMKNECLKIQKYLQEYGKIDTLNYEKWNANDLYLWILSIKDPKDNQSMFKDYGNHA